MEGRRTEVLQHWADDERFSKYMVKVVLHFEDVLPTEPFPLMAPPEEKDKHEERKLRIIHVREKTSVIGTNTIKICEPTHTYLILFMQALTSKPWNL